MPSDALPDRFRDRISVDHLLLAVVVALWAVLYLRVLGDLPLRAWDESRYVVPASHMAEGASWLDPQLRVNTHSRDLDITPRLVKPPLIYWLQAASMSVLGVSTFAARLPSALATLGCAGLVYHVGRQLYDRPAGFAGAVVLLVFPGMLLGSHGGRAAIPDPTLALFGSLFVWLTWRGRERPRLLVPAGACAGLAVTTKGFAAGAFAVAVVPIVLVHYRRFLTPWTAAAVATTALVALPWHLYAWLTYRAEFLDQYLYTAVLSRVEGEMPGPPTEPIFGFMNYPYFKHLFEVFAPPHPHFLLVFGALMFGGGALILWRWRRDGFSAHSRMAFLVWWTAAAPVTFSFAGGNQPWYIMPMYLPGAVVAGDAVATLAAAIRRRWNRHSVRDVGHIRPGVSVGDVADGLRANGLGDRAVPSSAVTGAYVVVCVVFALLLVSAYAPGPLDAHDPEQRTIGTAMGDELPPGTELAVTEDVEQESLMATVFYADRPMERTTLDRVNAESDVRYAIVTGDEDERLVRDHRVVVEGPINDVVVVAFTE